MIPVDNASGLGRLVRGLIRTMVFVVGDCTRCVDANDDAVVMVVRYGADSTLAGLTLGTQRGGRGNPFACISDAALVANEPRCSLWRNSIGPEGAASLGKALEKNSTLTSLK